MASIQTTAYSGRYLKLTVLEESYSIPNNTSTVRWTLESLGGGTASMSVYNCRAYVNGVLVVDYGALFGWDKNVFPARTGSTTGTLNITHNADGTYPAVSFNLHGKIYNNGDEDLWGSINLTTIPRYAVITAFNTSDVTMSSFKFNVSADRAIDSIQHSFNGGGWTDSGNQIISGLSPGTQYSIRCRVKSTASQLWTESGILYPTIIDIARITGADNINDTGSPYMTFTNPSGAARDA